jgi:hypothetical protein
MTTEEKKGHGCFFYGCLTVVIVLVVAAIGVGLAIWKVRRVAMEYTSDKPIEIPTLTFSPAQKTAFDARIQAFEEAMKGDQPARLVLTADEINARLNSSADFQKIGGKACVKIQGDQIKAAISFPIDGLQKTGLPLDFLKLKGRYLNGEATFRVGLQSGRLLVFLDQIQAANKEIPKVVMKELRTKNLAEDAMKDPDTAAAIAKLKSIAVQNGAIIIEK